MSAEEPLRHKVNERRTRGLMSEFRSCTGKSAPEWLHKVCVAESTDVKNLTRNLTRNLTSNLIRNPVLEAGDLVVEDPSRLVLYMCTAANQHRYLPSGMIANHPPLPYARHLSIGNE